MNKRVIESITNRAIGCNWEASYEIKGDEVRFEFGNDSPAGHDFSFSATMRGDDTYSLIEHMNDYLKGYNPDYEASLWIGEDGHGKNGVPYHIKDIVKDFEEIEDMMIDLRDRLDDFLLAMGTDDSRMSVYELSREQLAELKCRMLDERLEAEELRGISYGEAANIDHIIGDGDVFTRYDGAIFTDDDFFCTANQMEEVML